MAKKWMIGLAVAVLCIGNFGCYYDQWVQARRANSVLTEDLGRAKSDLQDKELLVQQKDTEIASQRSQLLAKEEQVTSLMAESSHLRGSLDKAYQILENLKPGITTTIISKQQVLPDALHQKLMELANAHPAVLEYDATKGVVRWKADLLFPLGSDKIEASQEALESLKEFASIVNSAVAAGFDVVVVGHTCTTPIMRAETLAVHRTNWHLSAHRAIAVMNLLSEMQVAMTRMGVMGYGEHRPIADNSTNAGKAKNRRVEIYLVGRGDVRSFSRNVRKVDNLGLAYVPAVQE